RTGFEPDIRAAAGPGLRRGRCEDSRRTMNSNLPIFHAEHRKLRETAANLSKNTAALYDSSDILGSILKLLDDESLFKHAQRSLKERERWRRIIKCEIANCRGGL